MENKHFKTDYLRYWIRFRKGFLFPFLVVTGIVVYVYFENEQVNAVRALLIILGFGAIHGLIQLYSSREFINEVKFIEDRIIIIGYNFNSHWEKELEIKNSTIEIKSTGQGRGNVGYFLRVKSADQKFDVNRSFNWDYFSLLDLFYEFKKIKGEKIIFDEKYFLDIMEKKAHGLSSLDIFFGKEVKK